MFFRQKAQFAEFALKDGLAVEVRATPSIYEARGEFQLNVETCASPASARCTRNSRG